MTKKLLKILLCLLLVLSLCACAAFSQFFQPGGTSQSVPGDSEHLLRAHYIDVGQGDAIYIELPNGQNMLIDAGPRDSKDKVLSYLASQGVTRIDYVVATHPHEDHIGGMPDVLLKYGADKLYMNKTVATTKAFERLLDAIESKGIDLYTAKAGVVILSESGLEVKIVAPVADVAYSDANNGSAVVRITYGRTAFLFMGDAELPEQKTITENIRADVLKVAHHGSKNGTDQKLLDRVTPQIAVITCGADNPYKHPSQVIVDLLAQNGVMLYRTDLDKTVVIESDGSVLNVIKGAVK